MSRRLNQTPEVLREAFYSLDEPRQLAGLLDVKYDHLNYYLYRLPEHLKYKSFRIPKRSGGYRPIRAPSASLKILQQKLNQILRAVYRPRRAIHGFVEERSVRTNAERHVGRRFVLNVDIEDFFPTINFGRVRGMFLKHPYDRNARVATVLAQLCCHSNELPQGAPTSPVVSNMICARLDTVLTRLAQANYCVYTRYADDITFSFDNKAFPTDLARADENGRIVAGDKLVGR